MLANATAVVDLLADDDTKDVVVALNGYISWNATDAEDNPLLTSASINCSAQLSLRETAQ